MFPKRPVSFRQAAFAISSEMDLPGSESAMDGTLHGPRGQVWGLKKGSRLFAVVRFAVWERLNLLSDSAAASLKHALQALGFVRLWDGWER
jgi:hypothetical protein